MMSNGTPRDVALSNHHRCPPLLPPSARCSTTFVLGEAALTALLPAVSSAASPSQLSHRPSGHSRPPLISLPTWARSAGVCCARRALSTSYVWSYSACFSPSNGRLAHAAGLFCLPGSAHASE